MLRKIGVGFVVVGMASAVACATGQLEEMPPPDDDAGNSGIDGSMTNKDGGTMPLPDGGCLNTQLKCSNTCIDPKTDNMNCGKCNNPCPMKEACEMGSCHLQCGQPTSRCVAPPDPDAGTDGGEVCVDLKKDNGNCGMCGNACMQGYECDAGGCDLVCMMGLTKCMVDGGPGCVDTKTDNANCGMCNNPCSQGKFCVNGMCSNVAQNIAPSGTVTISSGGNTGNYVPAKANNSVTEAQNCNEFAWITAGNTNNSGAWIQVTWGQTHTIVSMSLDTTSATQTDACGNLGRTLGAAKVQYWSNNQWVQDGTVSAQLNDWTYTFSKVITTDKVRLFDVYCTNSQGQQSNPQVYEWQIMGN